MSNKPNGGPAFPSDKGGIKSGGYLMPVECPAPGMSLRDWFAGMALQGLCACNISTRQWQMLAEEYGCQLDEVACWQAFAIADSMIKRRNQ